MMRSFAIVIPLSLAVIACSSSGGDDSAAGDAGTTDGTPAGDAPPFTDGVSTLAGAADAGDVDGARGAARFANPVTVALGPDGQLRVADFDNGKIRLVDPDTGDTSTLISQDNFRRPFAMAFDGTTMYVTTDYNSHGQKGPLDGTVWRVANGAATVLAEGIGKPRGIALLPDGRIVVADFQHHVLQTITPATGAVKLLAGTWDAPGMTDGAAPKFSIPYAIAVRDGEILVADQANHRIRSVALDGSARTLAGGDASYADGPLATARFDHPQGLAVSVSGDVYVTDTGNFRVRRIHGDTVETIAGSGEGGYRDDDDRLAAKLYGLEGLTVTPDGSRVFVADGSRGEDLPYNRVRSIKMQ